MRLALRYAILAIALSTMAMGIAFCVRADLGITPISCPPYILSLGLKPTIGQFTIIMHLLLIAGQVLLLRKDFRRIQLLQIVPAAIFGLFIDLCMRITHGIAPSNYAESIGLLLAGNVLLAAGVNVEMLSRTIMLPTDGFVLAVTGRTGFRFARVKMAFDLSLLLISVVCSLRLLGRIEGIREGTLVSALLVGFLVGVFRPYQTRGERWLEKTLRT